MKQVAEVNMTFLTDIIGALGTEKLERMNMYEVVTHVYEATYMRYSMKFYEEKAMREKLEKKVIEKVTEIDVLEARIKELEDGDDAKGSEDNTPREDSGSRGSGVLSL